MFPGLWEGLSAKIAIAMWLNCRATILFAGDAMQHEAQLHAAAMPDGSHDYTECYSDILPIVQAADYAVVNLETPLGERGFSGYPQFCAPVSYARALVDAGFDLLLTANNHTLDRRDRGLKFTIAALDSLHTPHIGTYPSISDRRRAMPFVTDIKGFKTAFLNYTYGTNGISPRDGAVVDYIDRNLIDSDIRAARNAGAEIICVALHWGDEYKSLPNSSQRALAKWLRSRGVDIIFGGHPHVVQPMELIQDDASPRPTALFYSLGNFISNMKTRDTRGGALARVTLRRDSAGTAYVSALEAGLVFVEPPTKATPNFTVRMAADSVDAAWAPRRDAFVSSATSLFSRHNVSVTPF